MPYKLSGAFIVLSFYVCILNISTLIISPPPANAQLSALSEIQSGIFFLSLKNMGITSETFKTDKYIDEEQAEYFGEISKSKLNVPSDKDHPFTLVDHYVLSSDLEIIYDYDTILRSAFPLKAYLSIHNISISDYTSQRSQPAYYITKIRGKAPFTGADALAMQMEVKNAEVFADEMIQKDVSRPGSDCYSGYGGNIYVKVISLKLAVWGRTTDTDLMNRCKPPIKNTTRLHPSDIRPEPEPVVLIVLSPDNPCIGKPFLPEAPRSSCYYPLPPERKTPAATNWSYNYNLRNNSSTINNNHSVNAQPADPSTCQTCR